MTAKTETAQRKPQPQSRPLNTTLAAKYGTIGCAAIRAALQFNRPAAAKAK